MCRSVGAGASAWRARAPGWPTPMRCGELRKEIWRQTEQVVIADLASRAPELTDPPQDTRTVFYDSRAAEGRPQPDENVHVRTCDGDMFEHAQGYVERGHRAAVLNMAAKGRPG
eukprot:2532815-Alexandrium_andersonii.AAC.1